MKWSRCSGCGLLRRTYNCVCSECRLLPNTRRPLYLARHGPVQPHVPGPCVCGGDYMTRPLRNPSDEKCGPG